MASEISAIFYQSRTEEMNRSPRLTRRSSRLIIRKENPQNSSPVILRKSSKSSKSSSLKKRKNSVFDEDVETEEVKFLNSKKEKASEEKIDGVSDYEEMVQNNIAERLKFLEELNIMEAKSELEVVAPTKKLKPSKVKKSYTEHTEKKVNKEKPRRSARILNKVDNIEISMENILNLDTTIEDKDVDPAPDPGPSLLHTYSHSVGHLSKQFVNGLKTLNMEAKKNCWSVEDTRLKTLLKSMESDDYHFAKVVPRRIYSIKVHPAMDKTLVLVGGKQGNLGIWDASQNDDSIFYYGIHSEPINCMSIDSSNANNIFTNSYDGSFRRLNLQTSLVEEMYKCDSSCYISWHAQTDSHTFVISGSRGFVDYVDVREPKTVKSSYKLDHNKSVKLVSVHPTEKQYMATGSANGYVSLWDLRNMKTTPIDTFNHQRSVSGLEFSRGSGTFLLSTCIDNYLRILKFDTLGFTLGSKIRHNNQTGRWLTTFRASWLPESERHFVVGSMEYPRRIEVWNIEGKLVHSFFSEELNSVMSVNSFHPTRTVLAGGNSSGKVIVFKEIQS